MRKGREERRNGRRVNLSTCPLNCYVYIHCISNIPDEPEDSLDIEVDRPMERIQHEKEREKGKERGREMERGISNHQLLIIGRKNNAP